MEGLDPAAIAKFIGTLVGAFLVGIFGWRAGKNNKSENEEPRGEARVISASFIEKASMDALTLALGSLDYNVKRLCTLMEDEAQRRHDEKVALQALREHGIKP